MDPFVPSQAGREGLHRGRSHAAWFCSPESLRNQNGLGEKYFAAIMGRYEEQGAPPNSQFWSRENLPRSPVDSQVVQSNLRQFNLRFALQHATK